MDLDLRLVRYFVAVAEAGAITHAAEALHIAQPSLSAAVKGLEAQLGVQLLVRRGRGVQLTPAGAALHRRGRRLLEQAEAVIADVREEAAAGVGRLRLGVTPAARYGAAPRLLAACAVDLPGVMLYSREETTGALLRDVTRGELDLAVTFCTPDDVPAGVTLHPLPPEALIVHLPAEHPLAGRRSLSLADLAAERVLVAGGADSGGFTHRIRAAFSEAGLTPEYRPDPYPDLGLRAVRAGLGVVIYPRTAFPAELPGSAFVPLQAALELPFHLVSRTEDRSPAVDAVLGLVGAA